ncbi:MAG: diacylglycerol kinase family protein [Chitinophagaceae bacterium]
MTILKSIYHAYCGIKYTLLHEKNFVLEMLAAAIVIIGAIVFKSSVTEWLAIVLCIGIVLSLEIVNTAIEKLCNYLSLDFHPSIKIIKDVSAGAVLLFCLVSLVIACIIFLPKIF